MAGGMDLVGFTTALTTWITQEFDFVSKYAWISTPFRDLLVDGKKIGVEKTVKGLAYATGDNWGAYPYASHPA
jgi:hypothetical protein